MSKENEQSKMMKVLDWAYIKALDGLPGMDTVSELAESYLRQGGTLQEKVDSLIKWQIAKCATSGFITGLGGLMTLPVAIPANVASVLYVQMRMIAAIAYMGGYDLRDDKVKSMVYVCLCGSAAADILKDFGIKFSTNFAKVAVNKISGKMLIEINKRVGFRLITKGGTTGLINLGKMVPIMGGLVGGIFDACSTKKIGDVAKKAFIADDNVSDQVIHVV